MHHLTRPLLLALLLAVAAPAPAAEGPLAAATDAELLQMFEPTADADRGRCGTLLVAEMQARNLALPGLANTVEDTLYYDTPGGRFRIAYSLADTTVGVDPTDADGSGVPDYIELVGSAFERSWDVEVDSLGFTAPQLGGGRYFVSTLYAFSDFAYTVPSTSRPGGSWIQLRYSMDSFCKSTDPPDCPTNALIATIAHEFKHVIQIASGWQLQSVGGWIELDASWIEDIVFDDSNDYYRFLPVPNSPFTAPSKSLASTPSYSDCTWQHFLSESYGADYLVQFSDRVLATQFTQQAQLAYAWVAAQRGIDWNVLWGDYTVANYLTSTRAIAGQGFEEAAFYPLASTESIPSLPWNPALRGLEDMAMRFYEFDASAGGVTGGVRVQFNGSANADWTLRAIYRRPGETVVVDIPVVAGVASMRPAVPIEGFQSFAVAVGNANVPVNGISPSAGTYQLNLGLEPIPVEPASVGGLKGRFRRPSGQ